MKKFSIISTRQIRLSERNWELNSRINAEPMAAFPENFISRASEKVSMTQPNAANAPGSFAAKSVMPNSAYIRQTHQ